MTSSEILFIIFPMISYQATLQYDGTDRMGFQYLEDKPTIQGDLELALNRILKGDFTTRAASRTDKGVHAIGQVVKVSTEDPTDLTATRLNECLPPHMRCLSLSPCEASFIPSMDQVSKEYRYLFSNIQHPYIAHASSELNIERMKTCVDMLKGRHDFQNFWSIGGISNTTVREILDADLTLIDPAELFEGTLFSARGINSCWQFRIVGTGFLKHMVRHLMGALFLVGSGRLSMDEFQQLLHGSQREQRPWKKADPKGLFLFRENY